MKSQNWGTVICSECSTRVSIDDAESCYNAELDDVYFVCTKCIEDENRQSPAVSDDSDEAVEQMRAADVALCSCLHPGQLKKWCLSKVRVAVFPPRR